MTHQDDSPFGPEVCALAQSLLDSAASDAPSPRLHRTVAGALAFTGAAAASLAQGANLAQSVAGAGAEASSLGAGVSAATTVASGAKVGAAAAALGSCLKLAPFFALAKWVAGGFVVAGVAVGALRVAERTNAPPADTALDRRANAPSFSDSHAERVAASPQNEGLGPPQPAEAPAAAAAPALFQEPVPGASTSATQSRFAQELAESRSAAEGTPVDGGPTREKPARAPGAEVTRAFGVTEDEPPPVPWTEPGSAKSDLGLGSFPPARPTRPEGSRLGDQLAGEVRLLDSARANVASGRLAPALAALNQYHSGYPNGVLRAEALALTVDAWLRAGNEAQARRWVQVLERAFPTSQHLERFSRLRTGAQASGGTRP
jgi:TolA-binding protein